MEVTEVRFHSPPPNFHMGGRLLAFCSITFDDCLVVHDVKLIKGREETDMPFLAFPSRKTSQRCSCGTRNPVDNHFCGWCGKSMPDYLPQRDRIKLFFDVCHPIDAEFRGDITQAVLEEYSERCHDGEIIRGVVPERDSEGTSSVCQELEVEPPVSQIETGSDSD